MIEFAMAHPFITLFIVWAICGMISSVVKSLTGNKEAVAKAENNYQDQEAIEHEKQFWGGK